MKLKNFLVNFTICASALFCGLSLVGVYQFLIGGILTPKSETTEIEKTKNLSFAINDPNSVLPLNYEEENLTDPKADETNEAMFDPEGDYSLLDDLPKGFKDFSGFTITNKNLDVDSSDKNWGELIAPSGFVEAADQYEFRKIHIGNGKIQFQTKIIKGISYEFRGEFLVKGNFYTLDPNEKVLKGILVKKRNGEVAASSKMAFVWFLETSCSC